MGERACDPCGNRCKGSERLWSPSWQRPLKGCISSATRRMGQYGDTDYLKWLFPTSMRSNLYRICYSPWGQEFSICNYWHDPHHDDLYLNASSFLALINGERDHPNATVWRKNFLRVGHLVLIGGPDDGVITPWQSSFFGFYDANETVLEMEEQLVSPLGLLPLLAAVPPYSRALSVTPELKGSPCGEVVQDPSSNSLCLSLCLSSMLPRPFDHLEGLSAGFFWVEDSIGPGGHSEVSNGRDLPHSLALQPYPL
ncbi:lysosomal thioesterase PPT2 isoform X5 [Pan troglodytes]|uniref:lysosomal thioesterase PPT2 isoform X5 n=1 Tax=Pan troglodytes TaxID=9598 RepID=UPI0005120748|nr:lysosomal thioesterase PPT2 isoform X7 [Pan troglodytes]